MKKTMNTFLYPICNFVIILLNFLNSNFCPKCDFLTYLSLGTGTEISLDEVHS